MKGRSREVFWLIGILAAVSVAGSLALKPGARVASVATRSATVRPSATASVNSYVAVETINPPSVNGIHLGDSRETVLRVMGKPGWEGNRGEGLFSMAYPPIVASRASPDVYFLKLDKKVIAIVGGTTLESQGVLLLKEGDPAERVGLVLRTPIKHSTLLRYGWETQDFAQVNGIFWSLYVYVGHEKIIRGFILDRNLNPER